MYKQILQSIEHIEIWPVISLVIFFVFFIGVLIYVIKTDREFINKMKKMPLDDGLIAKDQDNNHQEYKSRNHV